MKTIKLDTQIVIPKWTPARRAHWTDIPVPISAAICMCSLLLIAILVGKIQSTPAAVAVPTPALMIILGTSVPAPPTTMPAPPTPDQRVLEELTALREQVSQLQAAQQAQPQPEIVYVQAPAEQSYQTTSEQQPEQAAPTPEPPTPVDARTLAIQQHYANEHQQPAQAPAAQPAATQSLPAALATITTDVEQTGGQPSADWKMDHCIGSGAAERCH